jgi:integrase
VPIPRLLRAELVAHIAGKAAEDRVFLTPRGGPLRNSNFRHYVFDPAVTRAGLAPLTPHDLRDTAASLAVSAGANVKTIQRMLGHASAAMTLDIYAGLFDDDLDAVGERLSDAAGANPEDADPPDGADSVRTDRSDDESERS